MKTLKTLAAAAAIAATGFAFPVMADDHAGQTEGAQQTKGEAKLAKLLEGRVAGEPVSCISAFPQLDLTMIDGTALVYERGNMLWVNVPSNADDIDDRYTLVTRNPDSRLCKTDIVRMVDLQSGHERGTINLTDFIPYRKAD